MPHDEPLVPRGAAFFPVPKPGPTRNRAFVPVPGFTLLAFSSAVEPPRIAYRGGWVCPNRFRAFSKWISAFVMPPPLRASAG